MSARSSVCLLVSARLPLDEFSWNLILGTLKKICWKTPNIVTTGQKHRVLYMKTSVRLYCWQQYETFVSWRKSKANPCCTLWQKWTLTMLTDVCRSTTISTEGTVEFPRQQWLQGRVTMLRYTATFYFLWKQINTWDLRFSWRYQGYGILQGNTEELTKNQHYMIITRQPPLDRRVYCGNVNLDLYSEGVSFKLLRLNLRESSIGSSGECSDSTSNKQQLLPSQTSQSHPS
jgi:hypothetical protein